MRTYANPGMSILFSIMLTSALLGSCKRFLDLNAPETKVGADVVFSNDANATSSVVGLYGRMMLIDLSFFNGWLSVYPSLSADEMMRSSAEAQFDIFTTNSLASDNNAVGGLWTNAYNYIYHANACIEGINNSTGISKNAKSQLLGEAKFLRALNYFYLINLFGDVPLIVSTDYEENSFKPRNSIREVYSQIVTDLKEAKQLLLPAYIGTFRARPNKWAACALLSRVYLYNKEWANAESEATEVISSGAYGMPADLNVVFVKASIETIWQLAPVSTVQNTSEGNQFIPASVTTRPKFVLSDSLINAFETNDQRRSNWVKALVISGVSYSYPFKYKIKNGATTYDEYNVMLRLSEQYLIRAEARVWQDNIKDAQSDLNKVRLRAGLLANTTKSKDSLIAGIEKERRMELFCELGHRWFDLKRTDHADSVLRAVKGKNWQSTDVLYPIPYAQILNNPNLTPNKGYNP